MTTRAHPRPLKVQVRHPISGKRLLGTASHSPETEGAADGARVWHIRLENGGRLALSEFEARAFQLIVLEGVKKTSGAAGARGGRTAQPQGKQRDSRR